MSNLNVKRGGGGCPFAAPQNGGAGAADHVIATVGGVDQQKANPEYGNYIAHRGGARSSRRSSSKSRMAKLNKLLKRLKSLNARGGRRRSHACSRSRTRKNTTRRNRN